MADGCCGPQELHRADDTGASAGPHDHGPQRLCQVRELQLAAAAAVLLVVGWLIATTGADGVGIGLELAGAVVAAATFVPGALRNLPRRRIGVGTLMTIAAIGAVHWAGSGEHHVASPIRS